MSKSSNIPNTPSTWYQSVLDNYAESKLVLQQGLRGLPSSQWKSASKIQFEHFLLLRAYWAQKSVKDFRLDDWVSPQQARLAEAELSSDKPFGCYLSALKDRLKQDVVKSAPRDAGVFALVLYQQDQISRLPVDPDPESVPKVSMSPRYMTRARTNRGAQVSPTPHPPDPRRGSGQADPLLAMADMRLSQSSSASDQDSDKSPSASGQGAVATEPVTGMSPQESPGSDPRSSGTDETGLSHFSMFSPRQIKAARDEQIVNTALVSLLQALTMFASRSVGWAIDRNMFRVSDLYEARTDGCLLQHTTDFPLAILETKAHVRKFAASQIMMQETAQMASWIASQPTFGEFSDGGQPKLSASSDGGQPKLGESSDSSSGGPHRRLLLSQDNREIYITIATYDSAYKDYLKHTSSDASTALFPPGDEKTPYQFDASAEGPFLRMHCYGPFDVKRHDHMRVFAAAIVAFTALLEERI